jgi:hypothetical protein
LGQALSIFWPAISRGSSAVARRDSMPADVVAFTNDGEVRPAARWRPHRLGFVLAGGTSDLVGEVGH